MPKRGTAYQPILDKMKRLKMGKGFSVPIPENTDPKTFHNRMNAALKRFPVTPPASSKFQKKTSADGTSIVILCVEDTE